MDTHPRVLQLLGVPLWEGHQDCAFSLICLHSPQQGSKEQVSDLWGDVGVGVDRDSGREIRQSVARWHGAMSPSTAKMGLGGVPAWPPRSSTAYSRRTAQVAWGRGLNVKVVSGTVRSRSASETPG